MVVIRTRREGEVIREDRPVVKVRRIVKRPVVQSWGMSKTEQRLATDMPVRKDLTLTQWREWGDNLRVLNFYSYIGADLLSLNDSRDAVRSIHTCCKLRVMAQ